MIKKDAHIIEQDAKQLSRFLPPSCPGASVASSGSCELIPLLLASGAGELLRGDTPLVSDMSW